MELVTTVWCYREIVSLGQTVRNLNCGDVDCCRVQLGCIGLNILNASQWLNGWQIRLQIQQSEIISRKDEDEFTLKFSYYEPYAMLKTKSGMTEGLMLLYWRALSVNLRVAMWKAGNSWRVVR